MELVVDANILVSALLKEGTTRELMFNTDLILYTSEFIVEEFFEHIDKLAQKACLSKKVFQGQAEQLIIESKLRIISKKEVKLFIKKAEQISPDSDDVLYFATALKFNCGIWSNDKELKKQKQIKIYSTSDLLKLL